jgi:hypothetical protein
MLESVGPIGYVIRKLNQVRQSGDTSQSRLFWLDSHSSCEVRIRLDETEDPKPVFDAVQSLLLSHKCRLQSSSLYEDKGRMVFLLFLPNGVDPTRLEHEVRSKLRKNNVSKITVDLV